MKTNEPKTKRVLGKDLKPGDTMHFPGTSVSARNTITGFRTHVTPLAHLWPNGSRLVDCVIGVGTVAGNDDDFNVIIPEEAAR